MDSPKISVMIPCYNAKSFLAECLDSVLSQNVAGLQLVVSDDCCQDNTQMILHDYERQFPQIVGLYNWTNLGVTRNCNQALALCRGEYIALMAGDDVMLPGKLSMQVSYMEDNTDVVMTYHAGEVFDSDTGSTIAITNTTPRFDTNGIVDIIRKLGIAAPMSIVLRRSVLPEGGFNEELRVASDWLFQIEVAAKGRVQKLPGVWCRYRKHGVNNGKDLSSYEHEFEDTLAIVRKMYGGSREILRACDSGLARLKAGRAFRQLRESPADARAQLMDALRLDRRPEYLMAYIACWVPGLVPIILANKQRLRRLTG